MGSAACIQRRRAAPRTPPPPPPLPSLPARRRPCRPCCRPCSWELPFPSGNSWQLVGHVTRGGRLEVPPPEGLPGPHRLGAPQLASYLALMRRCWAQAPGERPAFPEIIQALK